MKKFLSAIAIIVFISSTIIAFREPAFLVFMFMVLAIPIKYIDKIGTKIASILIIAGSAAVLILINHYNPLFDSDTVNYADAQSNSVSVLLPKNSAYTGTYFSIPTDSNAKYEIIEKGQSGIYRTIITKRTGKSGETYSQRAFDCKDWTVKYIGTGDTYQKMLSSVPDAGMVPILSQSIAYYVGLEACK